MANTKKTVKTPVAKGTSTADGFVPKGTSTGDGGNNAARSARMKTRCGISRARFAEKAAPLRVTIAGKDLIANPKQFKSGSFGFFTNEKFVMEIDGVALKVQPSVSIVIVGSAEAE